MKIYVICLLLFPLANIFADIEFEAREVLGIGKMVEHELVEDVNTYTGINYQIRVLKDYNGRVYLYLDGNLFRLNRNEFVSEARISDDGRTSVFLVFRINEKYKGSDYSRIIVATSRLKSGSGEASYEIFESLNHYELINKFGDKTPWFTSLGKLTDNFPEVRLLTHREREKAVFELWNLREEALVSP